MTFEEITNWLFSQLPNYQTRGRSAYKENLDNISKFIELTKLNHSQIDTIHVGGTNGKGSVCHMLASVLQKSNLKVGLFTSPHVFDFRERIRVDGKMISKKYVIDFVITNKEIFEKLEMSFFEMNVALALSYFVNNRVDIAIIEVGLGGRLDATNIIEPVLSVVTNVSYDHTSILGNSLEKIAIEKAGIIKRKTPFLLGFDNHLTKIFKDVARENDAPFFLSNSFNYECDLKGLYQDQNINTCVSALKLLKNFKFSKEDISSGLENVKENTGITGRWQVFEKPILTICDIAHNVEALKIVFSQIGELQKKTHVIIGFSSDKDIEGIVKILPSEFKYYICSSSNSRIINPEQITYMFKEKKLNYLTFDSVFSAYKTIMQKSPKNNISLVTGSTFIVSDFLKNLDKV